MSKRLSKPDFIIGPKKRSELVSALRSEDGWSQRGGHNYDHANWLFAFDVKIHRLDLSFDHLLQVGAKDGLSVHPEDAGWVERARAKYDETFGDDTSTLEEWAVEDARRYFNGRGEESAPDDDSYNTLWNGTEVHARFAFLGRSGGWLVLKEFGLGKYGRKFRLTLNDTEFDDMDFATLRALDEYIRFVRAAVARPETEVEHQAAFVFFENIADTVLTTTEIDVEAARLVTSASGKTFSAEPVLKADLSNVSELPQANSGRVVDDRLLKDLTMKTFAVDLSVNGRNFAEIVQARSAGDAIAIAKMKWPGAAVFGARVIG